MVRYQRGHAINHKHKDNHSQHTLHLTLFNAIMVIEEVSVWNNEEAMQQSTSAVQSV